MITGHTELFCINPKDTTLTKGKIYTLDQLGNKCGLAFVSVTNDAHEGRWYSLDRFEIIDHVDISQLTKILEN